jgi:hypothetical protein
MSLVSVAVQREVNIRSSGHFVDSVANVRADSGVARSVDQIKHSRALTEYVSLLSS